MKEIAHNIYVSTEYPGVNVGLIVKPEGAIAVDAPTLPQDARAWAREIRDATGVPLLYVVLTDGHADRLLSAEILCDSGEVPAAGLRRAAIVATRAAYDRASAYTDGFWRGVVEGWTRRYPEAADDLAGARGALPEVLFTRDLTLHKGGVDVTVTSVAGAGPGSAWVRLPEQDVLFAGDTLVVGEPPILSAAPDTKAWLNTLTSLRRSRFSNTLIVPGRGPLCDQAATRPLSECLALARRRVRSLHTSGQARTDMAAVVDEILSLFSIPEDEYDWAQRRVKAGLDQLYEELQPE
jgi:glyoxylase-like metal-dependent hydrolase (beta-lactamase superfamily II)